MLILLFMAFGLSEPSLTHAKSEREQIERSPHCLLTSHCAYEFVRRIWSFFKCAYYITKLRRNCGKVNAVFTCSLTFILTEYFYFNIALLSKRQKKKANDYIYDLVFSRILFASTSSAQCLKDLRRYH